MRVIEHPCSKLLRQPKTVIKDHADGDAFLRRRGAPALRLTRVDRDDQHADAYAMVGLHADGRGGGGAREPTLARRLRSSIVTKGKPVPRPAS